MLREKKYVYICTGIVIFILTCIAAFNYWQDPADIFTGKHRYEEVVKEQCRGKTLVVASNYNERLFRKCVIVNGNNDYDVVVLGSSRVMTIGEENWDNNLKVINLGVSGGVLEDDMALWHCYIEKMSVTPKMVIIGVDPWLLNRHNGETRWQKNLANDYMIAASSLGFSRQIPQNNEGYGQLLSKKYTKESWRKWREDVQPLAIWTRDEKSDEKKSLLFPDGSLEYGRSVYQKDSDDEACKYIKDKVYHIEDYKELDVELQAEFIAFVQSIQQMGIEVVLFFPPYHPIVYNHINRSEKYKCVLQAEKWFMKFARDNEIKVIGNYNSIEMGLDGTAFFDGMHLKRNALKDVLKKEIAK